ncbi:TnsA-like heteromeric transposase endonuclease subunit [Streptomyces sp. SCL15-4]|uniref:TnsA-like heteromeric transposase endonuclease subunit n=1 Tax=Streptomyces sp. SCL15-4 TaxID=2967221 RepID=UPI002966FEC7|nr:TnsA-like heteromeric transposase endonuclease subunit [Streptomyces sp. SCL15-4]
MEVQVRYLDLHGAEKTQLPDLLRGVAIEEYRPLAVPRAFRGRRSILTQWWSATTGQKVVCSTESQMHAAMMLDFDPSVVFFGASCLEVRWEQGSERGAVRPAFFARTAHGERLALMHPWAAGTRGMYEEEAMLVAAASAGWTLRPLQIPPGVLKASLLRVANYRNPAFADPEARQQLLEVFARPRPLASGAAAVGSPAALSCAWHLLWTGELAWDHRLPLTPASTIWMPHKDLA